MSEQKVRPFLTYPMVLDWLQWGEFPERLDKPSMAQIALSLIQEYRAAIKALEQERDEFKAVLESICGNRCARGLNPCEAREALDKHEGKK